MDLFQSVESPQVVQAPPQPQLSPSEAMQNAETCILSQLYYCRFMSNLCDFLDESPNLADIAQLRSELVSKIKGKCEALMRLRDGENVLQVEGFSLYRNTEKWGHLREVIEAYFSKYREKYPN